MPITIILIKLESQQGTHLTDLAGQISLCYC